MALGTSWVLLGALLWPWVVLVASFGGLVACFVVLGGPGGPGVSGSWSTNGMLMVR